MALSLDDFIRAHNITLSAVPVERNPAMASRDMDNWKVTLGIDGRGAPMGKSHRTMTFAYSMGKGLGGQPPTLADVLESLTLEAQGVENARDFEDWASEYGYDSDSREAERIYKLVTRQSDRFRRFLGPIALHFMSGGLFE